jgi:hypothetical protein
MHTALVLTILGAAVHLHTEAAAPIREQPVSEIVLERGPCFGTCPIYQVTLRSDGSATFIGWNHVSRVGVYSGAITPAEFRRVADRFESARFWALDDSYLHPVTDLPVVRMTLLRSDSSRKAVRDHGAVGVAAVEGPAVLLELQSAIDRVADGITWSLVSANPGVMQPGRL